MRLVLERANLPSQRCHSAGGLRVVIYIVRPLMNELGLTAVRMRDLTRVATARYSRR
jgi:hypothetical protein